jgi:hypothetical protein
MRRAKKLDQKILHVIRLLSDPKLRLLSDPANSHRCQKGPLTWAAAANESASFRLIIAQDPVPLGFLAVFLLRVE